MPSKTSSQKTPQHTLVKLTSEISRHISFTISNIAGRKSKCRGLSISALREGHSFVWFISLKVSLLDA